MAAVAAIAHDPLVSATDIPTPQSDAAVRAVLRVLHCEDREELTIGGLAVRSLVHEFGSPLYLFDADAIRRRAALVHAALGPRVARLFSIKANPNLAITRLLRECGIGAEIASLGELEVALAAGHAAAALRFAGPGKTDAELTTALQSGLGCVHVESASEVAALSRIARSLGRRAGVAVRVNLTSKALGGRLRMAGSGARFGVDQDQVPELLTAIAGNDALQLRGLHAYNGTQCFDANAFVHGASLLCELAAAFERKLSVRLSELDLGGGFGVPTYLGDPQFDLDRAGLLLQPVLDHHDAPHRRYFVELGRYLTAEAGVYASTIVRTKTNGGRLHLALDGGLHHCAVAAGSGSVLRRPGLVVHASALQQPAAATVAIGGPLCTPQDQFADAVQLPPCAEGDVLAVLSAGAYGLSYSPIGFLGHPTPAEVLIDGGAARIVRARGTALDALRGQRP